MKDFLIVANGQFLPACMIAEAAENKTVIALDGAAEKLYQINLLPHVILGDFDSLSAEQAHFWGIHPFIAGEQPYQGSFGTLIVPAHHQDFTDLEKAIQYADQQQARSVTIVCATAGRLDHHEHTMHLLADYYRFDRLMLLHTEQQTLRYARDEQVVVQGKPGDKCGINARHTGRVSSQGLRYECCDVDASFCNELSVNCATLTVTGGALLILPPQLASQRASIR